MTAPALRTVSLLVVVSVVALGGCATNKTYDYTAFQESPPRSILILPPLNESTAVEATYSYLSTVSQPVAERGYYVFPVAVIDQFLKDNGMPTSGEMHEVPLARVREITGADAVLYPTVHEYGSKYYVIGSGTTVRVSVRLVDTRSGKVLWEGTGVARQQSNNGRGGLAEALIAAAVGQIINKKFDSGRQVSQVANTNLFAAKNNGLPFGPYHPDFGKYP